MTNLQQTEPINVGVIGVGSMGQHHVRIYKELSAATLEGIYDADSGRAAEIATEYGTTAYPLDELLGKVDAVSIAVPTQYHYDVAVQCIEAGVAPLIEKPIAETPEDGEELARLAERHGVPLQVGHVERFNPAVQTVLDIVPDLSIIGVHAERLGPPPERTIDDSAVMDLMIHDLDIVLALMDEDVTNVDATGTHDNRHASATLGFESGAMATLTASRLTQRKVRRLEITAEECLVEVDYIDQSVEIHRQSIPEYVKTNGDVRYRHESIIERPTVSNGEPLKSELESFLESVAFNRPAAVDARDGIQALELAQQVDQLAGGEPELEVSGRQ